MKENKRRNRPTPRRRTNRRAVILVIVLVVVVVLSLAAYTFSDLMLTYQETIQLSGKRAQARALVESGAEYLKLYLIQDRATILEGGGLYDNSVSFQAVPVIVGPDAASRANFTIIAPAVDDQGSLGGVRYGLEDESNRLNLNALLELDKQQEGGGRELLMALPGMTDDVADAILDWIDEDEEPREFGAETEYYGTLSPPYASKNAPLDTVEELLLVRGVTPQMLLGLDVNRNGMVDAFELAASGDAATSMSATDEQSERGWAGYITLHSAESNKNSEGFRRIFLNTEDMESLNKDLNEVFSSEWVTFIVAYRQFGPSSGSGEGSGKSGRSGSVNLDLSQPGAFPITMVLDLIGAKVEVPGDGEDEEATVLESPFKEDEGSMSFYMPLLMDNVTTRDADTIPGRININQAPREILVGIPGMTEEIADQILNAREVEPEAEDKNRQIETWILVEGIVTLDEMRALAPFVTAGGGVYRAHLVGYYEDGSASSRAEVLFDSTVSPPRVLLWRDISHLGRGYALETLGVQLIDQTQ